MLSHYKIENQISFWVLRMEQFIKEVRKWYSGETKIN